ncbi:MAG: hypothetical protein WD768_14155 [Phycisphaeraceae bacterium]
MTVSRTILHLDMDAFFASVEQHDHPELRGKPLLIGHDGPRGVVATASYEARPFGCRSAMPMVTAKRLCPQAIVVPVRGERYREVSRQMFVILEEYSPLVEPLSIDEAFLDLTGTHRALGDPSHVSDARRCFSSPPQTVAKTRRSEVQDVAASERQRARVAQDVAGVRLFLPVDNGDGTTEAHQQHVRGPD